MPEGLELLPPLLTFAAAVIAIAFLTVIYIARFTRQQIKTVQQMAVDMATAGPTVGRGRFTTVTRGSGKNSSEAMTEAMVAAGIAARATSDVLGLTSDDLGMVGCTSDFEDTRNSIDHTVTVTVEWQTTD